MMDVGAAEVVADGHLVRPPLLAYGTALHSPQRALPLELPLLTRVLPLLAVGRLGAKGLIRRAASPGASAGQASTRRNMKP